MLSRRLLALGAAASLVVATVTACSHAAGTRVATPKLAAAGARVLDVPAPEVIEIPSPNFNDRKGSGITAIVLHHTAVAVDAKSTAAFFKDPKSQVSSHYIVDRTGYVVRCVADDQRAWHAGKSSFQGQSDVNTFSIGIEICNVGDGVEPYPAAQVEAVEKLVAWLSVKYNIPMSRVTRHRDIALPAGRKQDTSNNFDVPAVLAAAQAIIDGQTPSPAPAKPWPTGYNPADQRYVVQKGDTLESIADDKFDTKTMASAIIRMNPGVTLLPGTLLHLPVDYRR